MGLDNGINLKIKNKEKFGNIPKWIIYEDWERKYGYDYEVNYWRKCWNVRREVLTFLGISTNSDGGDYAITINDLIGINKKLRKMYTKKNWDESQSIWRYKEIKRNYRAKLRYANRVAKWLKTKPVDSFELYFYDSY